MAGSREFETQNGNDGDHEVGWWAVKDCQRDQNLPQDDLDQERPMFTIGLERPMFTIGLL